MRTDPSVLPLSATTISAHKRCRSMARLALAMHCERVCSSFRQGITNDTSTRSLFIDGKGRVPANVVDRRHGGEARGVERTGGVGIGPRQEEAPGRRRAEIELAAEVQHAR